MKLHLSLLCATVVSLSLVLPASAASAAEPPAAPPAETAELKAWLRGPFGRVLGGEPANPATAYPRDAPLDTFIRSAPFVFETNIPIDELSGLSIVSEPVSPDASSEMLSAGETTFEGPAVVGRSIITATLTTGQGDASSHAWLVDVPDREGDLETLFEMVPPGVELRATDAVVTGTAGNGCYAYLCSDSGAAPVPSDLTPLRAAVGETLQIRTADGSGIIGWSGRLLPEAETAGLPLEVAHRQADPIGVMALGGLEPTAPGAWVLLLRVDLDRDRGWLWHAYRLTAE